MFLIYLSREITKKIDFFIISFDIINMKKVILLYIIVAIALFGCSEADTILPGDDIFNNPATPEGEITSLTASVSYSPTETNPVVGIEFSTPADCSSIVIEVEYNGSLVGTGDYNIILQNPPSTNIISIEFNISLSQGDSGKITLPSDLKAAHTNNSITLSEPRVLNFTVILP